MDPNFKIETDVAGIYFIANRKTGRWVITNNLNFKTEEEIFEERPFIGVKMIALNMGRQCNFNCSYCFVGNLKESCAQLEKDVGLKTTERVAELNEKDRHVVFHGSEPMINYRLIKELVLYGKSLGKDIIFSMQSNGSLFNDQNLEFLCSQEVGIGISFDGLRKHQNVMRPYKDGSATYGVVNKNLLKVKSRQKGISIITVITRHNIGEIEKIVESFEKIGAESVLFCPVNSPKDDSLIPNQNELIMTMQMIIDRYLQRKIRGENPIKIRNLKNYLGQFFKPKTTSNCLPCGAGPKHPLLAIDIDGSIYPCDYFWGREEYKIGDVFKMSLNEALNSPKNFRIYRDVEKNKDCNVCNWKRFCGGGCPGELIHAGKELEGKSAYCGYSKSLLTYVAKKIPLIHSNKLVREILEK